MDAGDRLQPDHGQQQVEWPAVGACGLLDREQPLRPLERREQEDQDLGREHEADHEPDRDRRRADDQPAAELDQVIQQRRARGLDLGCVVGHAAQAPSSAGFFARGRLGLAGFGLAGAGAAGSGGGASTARSRGRGFVWRREAGFCRGRRALGHRVEIAVVAGVAAHRLDLLPELVELGLPRELVEAGAELRGQRAHAADELADAAHQDRQVLGSDDDQRDSADDQDLQQPVFRKHRSSAAPDRRA